VIVEEEKFEEIHYIDRGEYIEIVAPWLNWQLFFMVGMLVFWLVFFADHYQAMFTKLSQGESFNVPLLLTTLIFAGAIVMRAVNKSYVFVTPDKLIVRHRPIPWFGNHEVPLEAIEQLYTYKRVRHGNKGQRTITYEVYVKSKTHETDIKIVTGLLKEEHGKFIERKIENWLGIKNMPVRERRALTDHF
jgi:hypothetical protein